MRYTVDEIEQDGFRTIRLADQEADLRVSVAPEIGNNAFAMLHRGHDFLWRPEASLSSLREKKLLFGIPFLAPWANRLDQDRYWVNRTPYLINRELGNIREDPRNAAHPWTADLRAVGSRERLRGRCGRETGLSLRLHGETQVHGPVPVCAPA